MFRNLVSPVLVGREAELAALTAALESAIGGEPALVLLGGEAGVGKTRLVVERPPSARAMPAPACSWARASSSAARACRSHHWPTRCAR